MMGDARLRGPARFSRVEEKTEHADTQYREGGQSGKTTEYCES